MVLILTKVLGSISATIERTILDRIEADTSHDGETVPKTPHLRFTTWGSISIDLIVLLAKFPLSRRSLHKAWHNCSPGEEVRRMKDQRQGSDKLERVSHAQR